MSTRTLKKQFSEQQKLQIISYYEKNSLKETINKFNVSSASIYRWKKQLTNNEDIGVKSDQHTKSQEHKQKVRKANFYSPNRDISTLNKEELMDFAQFWVTAFSEDRV